MYFAGLSKVALAAEPAGCLRLWFLKTGVSNRVNFDML